MTDPMSFASAVTRNTDPREAANELSAQIAAQLNKRAPDLALVFMSRFDPDGAVEVAECISAALKARLCLGCTAESVIGRDEEIENEPAISVVAACLPGVELAPFAIDPADWQDALSAPEAFLERVAASFEPKLFILLADPFTSPIDEVLEMFNALYAGKPLIGGMASGGGASGSNVLFLSRGELVTMTGGAVGVALAGALEVDMIVSQGCRPVGRPFTVTGAQRNILLSLEDQPPMARLQELFNELSEEDRELLKSGVYLGRAIDPTQGDLGRGDFLIRGVMGADPERGIIAVADYVNEGESVQFHLRDAATAAEDLEMMLLPQTFLDPPAGAFLFTCNGRGTRLYDHPNGDVDIIQNALGGTPLAGFFCAGEIGPVGGKNFLHGHTASLVVFRPASDE